MKPVFSTLIAASLALLTPQIAAACQGISEFTRQGVAFADVIFEGSLKEISPKSSYLELTFDVHDAKRGTLSQDEVVIGWRPAPYPAAWDISLEEFTHAFGEVTRVAISTPQLADKFCKLEKRSGSFRDEETGEVVTRDALRPVCDSAPRSLVSVAKENVPFVLSHGHCGSTYMYPVQTYENMRDYDENVAAFERAVDSGLAPNREIFRDKIESGSLPWAWTEHSSRSDAIAGTLFREQTGFFTPSLRTNAAWQASLLDLGEVMARERSASLSATFDSDEGALSKFRETLKRQIIKLLDFIEKDPNFRNRLLLDD